MDNLSHIEKVEILNQLKHVLYNDLEFDVAAEKTFKDADANCDNIVDKDELGVELKKLATVFGLPEPNKDTVEVILLKYDKDHDGKIDLKEWKLFFKNTLENFVKMAELHMHKA